MAINTFGQADYEYDPPSISDMGDGGYEYESFFDSDDYRDVSGLFGGDDGKSLVEQWLDSNDDEMDWLLGPDASDDGPSNGTNTSDFFTSSRVSGVSKDTVGSLDADKGGDKAPEEKKSWLDRLIEGATSERGTTSLIQAFGAMGLNELASRRSDKTTNAAVKTQEKNLAAQAEDRKEERRIALEIEQKRIDAANARDDKNNAALLERLKMDIAARNNSGPNTTPAPIYQSPATTGGGNKSSFGL